MPERGRLRIGRPHRRNTCDMAKTIRERLMFIYDQQTILDARQSACISPSSALRF